MERKRVNSSKLRSVGYDEKTRTLEVEMSNGQVFQYSGVYPEVYRRFMAAPNPTTSPHHSCPGISGHSPTLGPTPAIEYAKSRSWCARNCSRHSAGERLCPSR